MVRYLPQQGWSFLHVVKPTCPDGLGDRHQRFAIGVIALITKTHFDLPSPGFKTWQQAWQHMRIESGVEHIWANYSNFTVYVHIHINLSYRHETTHFLLKKPTTIIRQLLRKIRCHSHLQKGLAVSRTSKTHSVLIAWHPDTTKPKVTQLGKLEKSHHYNSWDHVISCPNSFLLVQIANLPFELKSLQ